MCGCLATGVDVEESGLVWTSWGRCGTVDVLGQHVDVLGYVETFLGRCGVLGTRMDVCACEDNERLGKCEQFAADVDFLGHVCTSCKQVCTSLDRCGCLGQVWTSWDRCGRVVTGVGFLRTDVNVLGTDVDVSEQVWTSGNKFERLVADVESTGVVGNTHHG